MHTYIRTYVRTYIHTNIHTYIHTHTNTCVYIYMYMYKCIHNYYLHMYACVCLYMCVLYKIPQLDTVGQRQGTSEQAACFSCSLCWRGYPYSAVYEESSKANTKAVLWLPTPGAVPYYSTHDLAHLALEGLHSVNLYVAFTPKGHMVIHPVSGLY